MSNNDILEGKKKYLGARGKRVFDLPYINRYIKVALVLMVCD